MWRSCLLAGFVWATMVVLADVNPITTENLAGLTKGLAPWVARLQDVLLTSAGLV